MLRRLQRTFIWTVTAFIVVPAAHAHGQERFRVLIPNFHPAEGVDKKFGEDAAKELRELVATLRPISRSTRRRSSRTSRGSR